MNSDALLEYYSQFANAPDAVARLRRLVVRLATRGKLAVQHDGDSPADLLIDRLPEEISRLAERGASSRAISTATHRPTTKKHDNKGWVWVEGSALFPTRSGNSKLIKGKLHSEPAERRFAGYSAAGQDVWLDHWEHEGLAVILSAVGARCGKAFLADGRWSAVANTHIIWIMPEIILPEFAMLHLNDEDFWIRSGGAQPFVKVKDTLSNDFALPPFAEQQRIVAKVEELMALCDRLEAARAEREAGRDRLTAATLARLNAPDPETFPADARFALDNLTPITTRPDQITQLRQTILNLAVRGKLVKQDAADEPALDYLSRLSDVPAKTRKLQRAFEFDDVGFRLPEGWVWMPLGGLIQGMDAGWSPQCENHPRSDESRWGVLKTTAVQALSFDPAQHKQLPEKLAPRPAMQAELGDILVTRAGPKNRVGVSCVVDTPCPRLMISDKLIRFHGLGELSARYLALTLNAGHTLRQIEDAKSGMAVMQMNISQHKLRAVLIPLPPLAEQNRIVAKVDEMMALCNRLEVNLSEGERIRSRLLESVLQNALEPA